MTKNRKTKHQMLTILILITIIFSILKLTNLISWSWWLVCSPLVIPFGSVLIYLVTAGLFFMLKQLK
ncbi:hypothetical protein [Flavobacterium panacagri]|uniref:hypothetical protein n=1 Tax=Flavobacterium panacagri TaxID=3034146 RepID=UPI0025A5499D|nr:hypothetical protein [Flavobacterium panacagri]